MRGKARLCDRTKSEKLREQLSVTGAAKESHAFAKQKVFCGKQRDMRRQEELLLVRHLYCSGLFFSDLQQPTSGMALLSI